MTAAAIKPEITPDDRLGLTICVAVIIHAMTVLGVSFRPEPLPDPRFEALEIILVAEKSEKPPEDAQVLAQANLEGGGDANAQHTPATPIKAPLPAPTPAIAASSAPPFEPSPTPTVAPPAPMPPTETSPSGAAEAKSEVEERLLAKAPQADLALPDPKPQADPETTVTKAEVDAPEPPQPRVKPRLRPTAAQLLTRSFALASLNAEIQQRLDSRAGRPRRKYISANTKEYKFAAYMEAWRAKVERIGNINYPEEARRRDLSGSLLLDVALDPDGSVREIAVRRSSGHKILDEAAVRIVKLASPFAPFPPNILKEVDILHVTRTWKFLNSAQFSSH